jgi:hypothetical protein
VLVIRLIALLFCWGGSVALAQENDGVSSRIQAAIEKGSYTSLAGLFRKLQPVMGKSKGKNETEEQYVARLDAFLVKNNLQTVMLDPKDSLYYDANAQMFTIPVDNVLSSSLRMSDIFIEQNMLETKRPVCDAIAEDTLIDGLKGGLFSYPMGADSIKTIRPHLRLAIIGDLAPSGEGIIVSQIKTTSMLLDDPMQLTSKKYSLKLKNMMLVLFNKNSRAILKMWSLD